MTKEEQPLTNMPELLNVSPPKQFGEGVEVVEDLEPTVEELKERVDLEKKSINEQMGWLGKTKQSLNLEVESLRVLKQKLESEVIKIREDISSELKSGEKVTKKVAALEVVNVLKKNVYILFGLLVGFVLLFPSLSGFALITVLPVAFWLVLWGYHFITSKRRMEDLKRRYLL